MEGYTKAEQNLIHVVKALGCIRYEQALKMLRTGDGASRTKIQRTVHDALVKGAIFQSRDKNYLLIAPTYRPNPNVVDAFYIAQQFISEKQLIPERIYHPKAPACVGFVDNYGKPFEVIAIPNNHNISDMALKVEEQYKKTQVDTDRPFVRYVFVLKSEGEIAKFPVDEVSYPYAFAIENYIGEDGISLRKVPKIELRVPELKKEEKYA